MQYLKETVFWNNTLFQYLIAIGILIISIVSMRLALMFLLKTLLFLLLKNTILEFSEISNGTKRTQTRSSKAQSS